MEDIAMAAGRQPNAGSSWRASLKLRYALDNGRAVLAERMHLGPLVVQKSLYPEGDGVCQNIIVHPPAGIVGGDSLLLHAHVEASAHAQLTTPGAAKWYRSSGPTAFQSIDFRVDEGAVLEWLPQESIVFDGAIADLKFDVDLRGAASFIGWDVVCLGRSASGERFLCGRVRQRISLARDGLPVFIERADLAGGDALLDSPVGLNGAVVFGTFIAAAQRIPDAILVACRDITAPDGDAAVTRMRGCLVARYSGASAQSARAYFARLWCVVRPTFTGRSAVSPRIWNT